MWEKTPIFGYFRRFFGFSPFFPPKSHENTAKIRQNVENNRFFTNFEIASHVTLVEIDKKRDFKSLRRALDTGLGGRSDILKKQPKIFLKIIKYCLSVLQ